MLRDMDLSSTSRVRRAAANFVCTEIDGELVFMRIDRGDFCSLRGTGLQAWKCIDEGGAWTPLSTLLGSLCERYEVDAQTCLNDLAVLLDELSTAGLAEVAP